MIFPTVIWKGYSLFVTYSTCFQPTIPSLTRTDLYLWIVVLNSMILDIILTLYGLSIGLIELNPVVLLGIETFGYSILAFLKIPALFVGFIGWITLPRLYRQLNLVGLSVPWISAVLLNSWLILSHG